MRSDAEQNALRDIQWREMAGAGNIYRHDYEDVAARRVWDTARLALPLLLAAVERELDPT